MGRRHKNRRNIPRPHPAAPAAEPAPSPPPAHPTHIALSTALDRALQAATLSPRDAAMVMLARRLAAELDTRTTTDAVTVALYRQLRDTLTALGLSPALTRPTGTDPAPQPARTNALDDLRARRQSLTP
jgi:hypothetical protein